MTKPAMALAAAAASILSAGLANAQTPDEAGPPVGDSNFDRGRNTSVLERPHPGYEALGTRLGGFMLFPRVDTSVTYDDNIFATTVGEISDTFATVEPYVDLVSNWSRHSLGLNARVAHSEYFNRKEESHTDYSVGANGTVDVDRSLILRGTAGFSHLSEPRSSIEATQFVRRPIEYDFARLSFGAAKEFNRLRIDGSYSYNEFTYENGVTPGGAVVFQGYRNRQDDSVRGKIDYAISPDTFVYLQGTVNRSVYEIESAPFLDRDSEGFDVAVGADFDLTNLARGHLQIGYLGQTFDDPTFGELTGVSIAGDIDYFPTQLTTLNFSASRNFQASGLIGSAGYSSTSVGVRADHELFRNVLLVARLIYEKAEHQGIDRDDNRYNALVGGTYLMNRNVGITASYTYFTQDSEGSQRGSDFNIGRAELRLTLQY